jgi:hypothetical protein
MSFYHAFHKLFTPTVLEERNAKFLVLLHIFSIESEKGTANACRRQSRKLKAMLTRNFCFRKLKRRTIRQFQVSLSLEMIYDRHVQIVVFPLFIIRCRESLWGEKENISHITTSSDFLSTMQHFYGT